MVLLSARSWWRPARPGVDPDGPVLEPGERMLASAAGPGGSVVATDRALLFPAGGDVRRVPWHTLATALWEDEESTLVLVELAGDAVTRIVLEEPRRVPEVVRERVTASIVMSSHVALVGSAGVWIMARRRPGTDEPLWQLRFDAEVPQDDPGIRARAEEAVAELRSRTGI